MEGMAHSATERLATLRTLVLTRPQRQQYQDDAEMQAFMADLLHVKYDFTGDGPLALNQPLPEEVLDIRLVELDGQRQRTVREFVALAHADHKPLAILTGSWT